MDVKINTDNALAWWNSRGEIFLTLPTKPANLAGPIMMSD